MYSPNIAEIFGITALFGISYQQYFHELDPTPKPRNPPDKAKYTLENSKKWACISEGVLYMRWPDRLKRPNQSDLWFDRLVFIHHEGNYDYIINKHHSDSYDTGRNYLVSDMSITINGIILDHDRILTAYNPFRQIINFAFKRHFTHVCALEERKMGNESDDETIKFKTSHHKIACARQVVPLDEAHHMPRNLWHGRANKHDSLKQHSPLHDLMVIRIEGFIPNMTKDNYDFEFLKQYTIEYLSHGPQNTILAKKDDVMGSEFKYAMMGHIFARDETKAHFSDIRNQESRAYKDEVKRMRDTFVGKYLQSENAVVDCDEWIPRQWGLFICVLNLHGLDRLASGAALYSRGLLFGIGSFTLYKGNDSIIVFTDVRPYESLINDEHGPCTTTDQFGKPHAKRRYLRKTLSLN